MVTKKQNKSVSVNVVSSILFHTYRTYSSERRGARLILGSQRGALIRGRHSFQGGAHEIYQKDIKVLSTCLLNQTKRTIIITEE